jgi:hypothetical protein
VQDFGPIATKILQPSTRGPDRAPNLTKPQHRAICRRPFRRSSRSSRR